MDRETPTILELELPDGTVEKYEGTTSRAEYSMDMYGEPSSFSLRMKGTLKSSRIPLKPECGLHLDEHPNFTQRALAMTTRRGDHFVPHDLRYCHNRVPLRRVFTRPGHGEYYFLQRKFYCAFLVHPDDLTKVTGNVRCDSGDGSSKYLTTTHKKVKVWSHTKFHGLSTDYEDRHDADIPFPCPPKYTYEVVGTPVPTGFQELYGQAPYLRAAMAAAAKKVSVALDKAVADAAEKAWKAAGRHCFEAYSYGDSWPVEERARLIQEHWPLKCHTEMRNGKMSMCTNVAIVGAVYHKGATDELTLLDRKLKDHPDLKVGLELRREPNNKHDPNAVAVWHRCRRDGKTRETMLGYVPRQDARVVARVLDSGVSVRALYRRNSSMELWWPASTKEGVDEAYRRAMAEGEGL